MPQILSEKEAGEAFLLNTEEAKVYVYFLPVEPGKSLSKGGRGEERFFQEERKKKQIGRRIADEETEFEEEAVEVEEADDDEIDDDDNNNDDDDRDEKGNAKDEVENREEDEEQDDEEEEITQNGSNAAFSDSFLPLFWAVGILPLEGMDNLMDSVVKVFSFAIPLVILLAALCGWIIAGRSLKPLRQITLSARSICDGQDLSLRLPIMKNGDEVQELSQTFNGMMERLQLSFESERQFTSDAAHELRTPTAVILAETEMALSYLNKDSALCSQKDSALSFQKDPALTDSLEEIHRQARKMTELIRALLSYTRLEQGTRRIEKELLNLSELAFDICEEQRLVAPPGTEILFAGGQEVWVKGDVSLLIILLSNLISNAVKYGKEGGHVWVTVREEKGKGLVSVKDDGIGISQEDLGRIFNRFYQADKARSDEEKRGIGLGLSLAKQIARLHGGKIKASSTLGEGSEFLFSMPLSQREG